MNNKEIKNTFRIAAIPGDGIGKEVLPEGIKVLKKAAEVQGITLEFTEFDWACSDYYIVHGDMLPTDWKEILQNFDAIYFGAVGDPQRVPDHISLWGSLLKFRREFDLYANVRPVRLFRGVPCPLIGKQPGDIDFVVVRENTEGEYSSVGGMIFDGTEDETVMQQSIFTRKRCDRILRYAFEMATKRPRQRLTAATKSNGMSISMPYWDERTATIAKEYPQIQWNKEHIDALCAKFVLQPERFDIVVCSNLFGDILSDLGPACVGTLGLAASANLNPERRYPSLFEPVHGSAPDIAGKNIANPLATIWCGALMLEFFAEQNPLAQAAADAIMQAMETVLQSDCKTPDLGGTASTQQVGDAVVGAL